jgi:class 3 adenylate cyclase
VDPVSELLGECADETQDVLAKNPPVEDADPDDLDAYDLPDSNNKTWFRLDDVVVAFADLQNSTRLGTGKHAASTAAIYRAATGNVVRIFNAFSADFIQIQGDGVFAVFWGERRYERALCAGVTVKTFSAETLVPKLESRWKDDPTTGFKVGIASGRTLVKNLGTPRNESEQEPVWAGKPVNFAAKAAQQAKRHELIVTGSVWDAIRDNDYLTVTCACDPTHDLWKNVTIEKLNHDEDEAAGRLLESSWCARCRDAFCDAIMSGETNRDDAGEVRESVRKSQQDDAFRRLAEQRRAERRAHRKGSSAFGGRHG